MRESTHRPTFGQKIFLVCPTFFVQRKHPLNPLHLLRFAAVLTTRPSTTNGSRMVPFSPNRQSNPLHLLRFADVLNTRTFQTKNDDLKTRRNPTANISRIITQKFEDKKWSYCALPLPFLFHVPFLFHFLNGKW